MDRAEVRSRLARALEAFNNEPSHVDCCSAIGDGGLCCTDERMHAMLLDMLTNAVMLPDPCGECGFHHPGGTCLDS